VASPDSGERLADLPLYSYIWRTSRPSQLRICVLIALVTPLSAAPLELQRRMVDDAIAGGSFRLLGLLGLLYLAVLLVQGALKYVLNLTKGRVLEEVTRDLRHRTLERVGPPLMAAAPVLPLDEGTSISILAAEAEDVGGFAAESLAVPLLQSGTIAWILAYLLWVEPLIAGLALMIYSPQAIAVPLVQQRINRLARHKTALVRRLGAQAARLARTTAEQNDRRRARAASLVARIFQNRLNIYRWKYFLTFLGNLLDSLGPLIVLLVGGWLVINGESDVGTLVVFISGFQKLAGPWDELVNFYRTVSNARVSYALVAEALTVSGGPQPAPPRTTTPGAGASRSRTT